MATIREIIAGRAIVTANSSDAVMQTAQMMVEQNIGAVPVIAEGQLVGIFSERDIMKRVMVEGRNPQKTTVGDVMTPNPLVVSPDEKVGHCLALMKQHGFRHLPVWDGKQLVGFLSLRDLLLREVEEKDGDLKLMREYIHSAPGS
jgi:CBS domain-containing protein